MLYFTAIYSPCMIPKSTQKLEKCTQFVPKKMVSPVVNKLNTGLCFKYRMKIFGLILLMEINITEIELKSLKQMKQMGSPIRNSMKQMGSSLAFCLMTLEWQKARLTPFV